MARYVNWKGERKQNASVALPQRKKRRNGSDVPAQNSSDLDMSFGGFYGAVYHPRCEKSSEGKHLADEGAYYPHEDTALFSAS